MTLYLKRNPVFRKVIIPWYDSQLACYILIVAMCLVFLFGVVGVSVSCEFDAFAKLLWIPWLLMILSAILIISCTIRLIRNRAPLPDHEF